MSKEIKDGFPSVEDFKRNHAQNYSKRFTPVIETIRKEHLPMLKEQISSWLKNCRYLDRDFCIKTNIDANAWDNRFCENVAHNVEQTVKTWFESAGFITKEINVRVGKNWDFDEPLTKRKQYADIHVSISFDEGYMKDEVDSALKPVKKGWFS